MKKMLISVVCFAVIAIGYSFMGASSVSASPANPGKGTGCFVRDANEALNFDENCSAHDVIKFDDEGNLEFYEYQDQGTLPQGAARPTRALRFSYDACFEFSFGVVCGSIDEIITPGGEYKSSFRAH